jgi:nicotinic acid mononucleotide adenylyltransferase
MAIKNFSQYLVEAEREVFFTFGRMNPPTIGHGKVMDVLSQKSGKADYKVFVSQSQNSKKDPLSYSDKIKHIRKMFPKHGRNVMVNKKVKTAFDAVSSLYDQGYKNVTMIVGADRVREFDVLLKKYNGVKCGLYLFVDHNISAMFRKHLPNMFYFITVR